MNPVAGDVTIAPVSTSEDSAVRFLNALALTDTDGSEAITGITVNAVPAGWVIRDENGSSCSTAMVRPPIRFLPARSPTATFRNYIDHPGGAQQY